MKKQEDQNFTIDQAYDAAYSFLDALYFQEQRNDDLAAMLGGMQRLKNGETAEASYWVDWMHSYWACIVAPTPEEKQLFYDLVADPTKCVGTTYDGAWYAEILPDGQRLWANVWNTEFQYGGKCTVERSEWTGDITEKQAYQVLREFIQLYISLGTLTDYLQKLQDRMSFKNGCAVDPNLWQLWQSCLAESLKQKPS